MSGWRKLVSFFVHDTSYRESTIRVSYSTAWRCGIGLICPNISDVALWRDFSTPFHPLERKKKNFLSPLLPCSYRNRCTDQIRRFAQYSSTVSYGRLLEYEYSSCWGLFTKNLREGGRAGRGGAGWADCKGCSVDLRHENVIARAL